MLNQLIWNDLWDESLKVLFWCWHVCSVYLKTYPSKYLYHLEISYSQNCRVCLHWNCLVHFYTNVFVLTFYSPYSSYCSKTNWQWTISTSKTELQNGSICLFIQSLRTLFLSSVNYTNFDTSSDIIQDNQGIVLVCVFGRAACIHIYEVMDICQGVLYYSLDIWRKNRKICSQLKH